MKYRRRNRRIRHVLLVIIAVCLFRIAQAYGESARHKEQQLALIELTKQQEEDGGQTQETAAGPQNPGVLGAAEALQNPEAAEAQQNPGAAEASQNPGAAEAAQNPKTPGEMRSAETPQNAEARQEPVMLAKYTALHEKNEDIIGWLSIEGMMIDYPVMQCGDDEYYLNHDFYGNRDSYGCLYVRGMADVNTPGTNFIIYGHNMRDGSMFGDLDLYRDEGFYREHSLISFDTLYEERTYEIVAVFLSRVYNSDDEVFKYYRFYQADTQEEFDDFYENIKALSLYDTGVEAQFGDTFLTLSTCAYHVEDGRFVVVAKRTKRPLPDDWKRKDT